MNADLIHQFVLVVLLPCWLAVGLADWFCHRESHIATTTGPRESLIHLLLSAQAGVAVLAGLFFEINALVLAIMFIAFLLHEAATAWDVHIAHGRREISVTEQRVHDYLTAIPFAALCLVGATHADQTMAMIGFGDATADWSLSWKEHALPTSYLVGWIAATLALNQLPFGIELKRGLDAKRALRIRRQAPTPSGPKNGELSKAESIIDD